MNNFGSILLIFFLIETLVIAQNFAVNLTDSLLLNHNYSGISTIAADFEGNFLVGFFDGTARKYTPDFSSYTNFYVPSVINFIRPRSITGTLITLNNGTQFPIATNELIITTNNYTTIRGYNYYTYV